MESVLELNAGSICDHTENPPKYGSVFKQDFNLACNTSCTLLNTHRHLPG